MSDTEPTPENVVVPGPAEPAEGTVGSSVPPEQPEEVEPEEDEDPDEDDSELEDVARQVINGEWGTGQEQRLKLDEAGYDHRKVEKVVTRLRNNL
jgi:hypothetical protein